MGRARLDPAQGMRPATRACRATGRRHAAGDVCRRAGDRDPPRKRVERDRFWGRRRVGRGFRWRWVPRAPLFPFPGKPGWRPACVRRMDRPRSRWAGDEVGAATCVAARVPCPAFPCVSAVYPCGGQGSGADACGHRSQRRCGPGCRRGLGRAGHVQRLRGGGMPTPEGVWLLLIHHRRDLCQYRPRRLHRGPRLCCAHFRRVQVPWFHRMFL